MHPAIPTIAQGSLVAKDASPYCTVLHISSKLRTEALKNLIICQKYSNSHLCANFAKQFARRMAVANCECLSLKLLQLFPPTTKLPINSFSYLQCLHSHREDLDYYWVLVLVQSCVLFL